MIRLHAFGLLVGLAILLGARLVNRRADRFGLDVALGDRLVMWLLGGGFVGAHLVHQFVYFPADTFAHPWKILRFWDGLSSFGGFAGALAAALIFLKRNGLWAERWRYLDVVAYALPFGWTIGRLGCFIAFDHPGDPTTFWLGEADSDGIVRHNLGLEEAIYSAALSAVFYVLGRTPRAAPFFTGLLAVLYAPVRFGLDFLRTADVRYLGLTPGQWGSIALLGLGVLLLRRASAAAHAIGTHESRSSPG